jgi:uncharacterized protein YdhG (YjbR/CyaY superfamily)
MSPEKSARKSAAGRKTADGFSNAERAAMKERAQELKAASRHGKNRDAGEKDMMAKIADMEGSERAMAERLHAIIMAAAPTLEPKTWYGMPAWALNGKVLCFFQSARKFKTRYATLGFSDEAKLDDGAMWPASFALVKLTAAEEKRITALVRQAVG